MGRRVIGSSRTISIFPASAAWMVIFHCLTKSTFLRNWRFLCRDRAVGVDGDFEIAFGAIQDAIQLLDGGTLPACCFVAGYLVGEFGEPVGDGELRVRVALALGNAPEGEF